MLTSSLTDPGKHRLSVTTSYTRKTVLVVEDDEDIGPLIMSVLFEEGAHHQPPIQAILAVDSLQALEMMSTITPNLFVLDYYLPRMNGIDLYDRLHAMEGLEQVPAIFMSANPPIQEIEKRHLTSVRKPFNLDELWSTVSKLIIQHV
jgi:CheY-like chemotaxis protein